MKANQNKLQQEIHVRNEVVKLYSIDEVAKMLNVKKTWVRSQIFKKTIPHIKVGNLIRFSEENISEYLKKNQIHLVNCKRIEE